MDKDMIVGVDNASAPAVDAYSIPSYAGLSEQSGSILGHVVFMVLVWFFELPIAIMFSISQSKLALPMQLIFLALNGLRAVFGNIYNMMTPDLYENNAHHKIDWIGTWEMTAQSLMSLIFVYSGSVKTEQAEEAGRAVFLPIPVEAMPLRNMRPYSDYRWSGDSGQGTESSSMQNSRDVSPTGSSRRDSLGPCPKPEAPLDDNDDTTTLEPVRRGFLRNNFVDKYLSKRLLGIFSKNLLKVFEILYNSIERTILILGFIAFLTGGVTYAGIFRQDNIFNGLAHFVKGGRIFWYGLLTLGRWIGCFADVAWAWNVRPG